MSWYLGVYLEKRCCLFDQMYERHHAIVSVKIIIFDRQTVLWLPHQQCISRIIL